MGKNALQEYGIGIVELNEENNSINTQLLLF
jgi:hypothetical protein